MQQNKAFHLLRCFDTWELRSLDKYLRSPFFHTQSEILLLWELVWPLAPAFSAPILARRQLFAALWPGEPYQVQQLRYLLSDFTRLIEGFWAFKQWEGDSFRKQQDLMRAYESRGQRKYFEQQARKVTKGLSQSALSSQKLQERFLLEEIQYLAAENKGRDSYPVQSVLQGLDQMSITLHLKYACEGVNRAHIYRENWQAELTPFLLQALQKNDSLHTPLSRLYQLVYQMLTEPTPLPYFEVLEAKLWEATGIEQKERIPLFFFALNFCIRRINAGEEAFRARAFQLYQQALTQNMLLDPAGFLEENHFKNLVALGTRLQAFDWTEQFIEDYQDQLAPALRTNAYRYNLAYLSFAQQAYRKVLQLLQQVEFTQVFYQLGAKTILIRTYFETEEYEALRYQLRNFRSYLSREKSLSEAQRKLYVNLCQVMQLLNRYVQGARVSPAEIRATVHRKSPMAAAEWVEEKVKQLIPADV